MSIALYQIECITPKHFYIGITAHPRARLESHCSGHGAKWVKLHGIKHFKVLRRFRTEKDAKKAENRRVLELAQQGYEVRGGPWTQEIAQMPLREPKRS